VTVEYWRGGGSAKSDQDDEVDTKREIRAPKSHGASKDDSVAYDMASERSQFH